MSLHWDYKKKMVDISMPGFTKKLLQRFQHKSSKPWHSPFYCTTKKYGNNAQLPLPINESPCLDQKGITRIQHIIGTILYYARCINITLLMILSTIIHKQTRATKQANLSVYQTLDY